MTGWKRRFIVIWAGQLFSILSSAVAQFAIILFVSLRTGSAEVLAFATIAALLPQIVIGPFAGVFVDRWSRKRTMIGADGFVALCSLVMAVLFYLDMMEMWSIYLLLMLRSIGNAFHTPAMKSSIVLLAPKSQLVRIAGINQGIQSVCNIGGPAIGAILVVSFDMTTVMMVDVVGALIACTTLLFVTIPNPKKRERPTQSSNAIMSVLREMHEGLRAILRSRGISWIMLSEILCTFFIMPIVALYPLMTLHNFNGSAYDVGLIDALFGVGMLLGSVALGLWNPSIRKTRLICWSYILFGLSIAAVGLLPSYAFVAYAAFATLEGVVMPFYTGPFTALLQSKMEVSVQGRVFALFDSASLLPSAIGLLAVGFAADMIGVAAIFVATGLATVATAAIIFSIPSVKNLER